MLTIIQGPEDRPIKLSLSRVDEDGEMFISIERISVNAATIDRESASDIIEHLKKEFGLDQWIPVTERLPDILQEVNVLFANGYVTSLSYGESSGFFSPLSPIKVSINNPVTHWQPLPGTPASVPQVSQSDPE